MSKLPLLSGKEVVQALGRVGFEVDHQTGSHIILRHRIPPYRRVSIPNHKEVAKGTLRSILRHAGLNRKTFLDLL